MRSIRIKVRIVGTQGRHTWTRQSGLMQGNEKVKQQLLRLYDELFEHDGFGEVRVEMRLLRRGQKEVILHCGKQYRFVVDYERHDGP